MEVFKMLVLWFPCILRVYIPVYTRMYTRLPFPKLSKQKYKNLPLPKKFHKRLMNK